MTLGGLALAVGILVDDATVTIENMHRNIGMRKPWCARCSTARTRSPSRTFVSTLSICIVFVPVLLLTGAARYLFTPLAMAVVFAMLASYLLSRTLVPTMMQYLLESEVELYRTRPRRARPAEAASSGARIICSIGRFEKLRYRYIGLLDWSLDHRGTVLAGFMRSFVSARWRWHRWSAKISSPRSMPGRCDCMRAAPAGTRIEETELRFAAIEAEIRRVIPAG